MGPRFGLLFLPPWIRRGVLRIRGCAPGQPEASQPLLSHPAGPVRTQTQHTPAGRCQTTRKEATAIAGPGIIKQGRIIGSFSPASPGLGAEEDTSLRSAHTPATSRDGARAPQLPHGSLSLEAARTPSPSPSAPYIHPLILQPHPGSPPDPLPCLHPRHAWRWGLLPWQRPGAGGRAQPCCGSQLNAAFHSSIPKESNENN